MRNPTEEQLRYELAQANIRIADLETRLMFAERRLERVLTDAIDYAERRLERARTNVIAYAELQTTTAYNTGDYRRLPRG
jgi:hypothetical protein